MNGKDNSNIGRGLSEMAEQRPYAPAIYFPDGRDGEGRVRYTHLTYKQLQEESSRIAHGLATVGIARGTRVALMVRPSLELFSLVFGLFKAGMVPVMVDPGIGLKNMKSCLNRARPEAFIGIPAAQAARVLFGWGRSTIKTIVTVGRRGVWGGHSLKQLKARAQSSEDALVHSDADEIAAILFTSGSTGPPKGAVYTHGNFSAQVESIREMYSIEPGEVDLPTFPLFALFDPALGMSTVIPDMDPTRPAKANPALIVEAIENFGITNMFGSPALLNTLGRYGESNGIKLPTLKRVISAGAPVPDHVLARIRSMMADEGQVVTPYGATECLPVASVESREVLEETAALTARGHGTCVGRPVDSIEVKIIAIDDTPIDKLSDATLLPPGELGEIIVQGPQATSSYWEAEEHTALAKIQDGSGFWHRMGDLGYVDEKGRLFFCGRKSQRVVTDCRTYFTGRCEGIFNAHPAVYRSALVRLGEQGSATAAVCVELEPGAEPSANLMAELAAMASEHHATEGIELFFVHSGFPVDIRHNAKIRREELGRWAQKQARP